MKDTIDTADSATTAAAAANPVDNDEIDLDDEDEIDLDDDNDNNNNSDNQDSTKQDAKENSDKEVNDKQDETITTTSTKKSNLQDRLRKLKLKMNQSRQLNRKEVLSEGERIGSRDAEQYYRKSIHKQDKARKEQEWDEIHSKSATAILPVHATQRERKMMMQSGTDSLYQAQKKADRAEKNVFSTNDYYNPEGQFRNYERSLKSVTHSSTSHSSSSSKRNVVPMSSASSGAGYDLDSKQHQEEQKRERDGARRLADEMKRRATKTEKRKQKQMDFEAEDVSYINQRNKKFNEKINRTYDKHTAEIKQNLERGTAL